MLKAVCEAMYEDKMSQGARASQAGARCMLPAGLDPQGASGTLLGRENTTEYNRQSRVEMVQPMEGPHSQEQHWGGILV